MRFLAQEHKLLIFKIIFSLTLYYNWKDASFDFNFKLSMALRLLLVKMNSTGSQMRKKHDSTENTVNIFL
jgi:hypothetical protein